MVNWFSNMRIEICFNFNQLSYGLPAYYSPVFFVSEFMLASDETIYEAYVGYNFKLMSLLCDLPSF